MKVVFVQLPVLDPRWESARANVPLAAANLVAWALARGTLRSGDWAILDEDLADYGGDAAVLRAFADAAISLSRKESEPFLACFSLYAWNVERSSWMARKLKALIPGVLTVAGGPEIASETAASLADTFDILVEGEGEAAFSELLSDLSQGRGHGAHYESHTPIDLAELPEPYGAGILAPRPDKQVYVESMRGCPARCTYCNYGKRFESVRHFPDRRLYDAIELANARGARDLYLLDPSFQAKSELAGTLARIAASNRSGLALHAEIRLESVDEELAMLYAEAGVVSIEAGLQSTNPKALMAVGRGFDAARFERGAELMRREGILIKTGVILGLPEDRYADVIKTFDFLGMTGLGQDAELYPLSLLPGTVLRRDAASLGIRHFDFPPYWAMSTKWLSGDEMADAVAAFEESFDLEWGPFARPHFAREAAGFTAMLPMREREAVERACFAPETMANSITVVIDSDDDEQLTRAARAASIMRQANPHALYQIVLYSNLRLPKARATSRIVDAFANPDHYFEHSHYFSRDPQKSWQTRVFFATRDPGLAADALESGSPLEIALVWGEGASPERHPDFEYLAEMRPFAIYDRDTLSSDSMRDLVAWYADYRDLMLEAPASLFPM